MAKKIVEVKEYKYRDENRTCYVFDGIYVGFSFPFHSPGIAQRAVAGWYQRLSSDQVAAHNLTNAPTIHTYEVEVDDE